MGKVHIPGVNIIILSTNKLVCFVWGWCFLHFYIWWKCWFQKKMHLNAILVLLQISQRSFRWTSFTIFAISELLILCIARVVFHLYNHEEFSLQIKYVSGSYDNGAGFELLNKTISENETSENNQPGNSRRLFYLALPPSVYPSVCKMIRSYCMTPCELLLNDKKAVPFKVLKIYVYDLFGCVN